MSAHAIFVGFIPKRTKLARTVPRLWGRLSPLEPVAALQVDKCRADVKQEADTVSAQVAMQESVIPNRAPSFNLRLVADAKTSLSSTSAIYIDLDDYQ